MKIVEELKEEVKKLSNTQAITFIYSLLRRQKNMFGGLENAQYVFDEITKKFRGEEIDDEKLMESINRYYMESIFASEESEGAMENVCFFLENANAFYNQLGNTDDIDYAFAQMNFDMLEGILCEKTLCDVKNEEEYCRNKYVVLEKERAYRDLALIKKNEFQYEANCDEALVDDSM